MAQRFAVESTYAVSSIFAPGGHFWVQEQTPARARSILLMWGTEDKLNPMAGGKVPYRKSGVTLDKPAPETTATGWAKRLDCKDGPNKSTPSDGINKIAWINCTDNVTVELYKINSLGHHWAGGRPVPFPNSWIGPYSDRVHATEMMWEFFTRRSK